MQRTLSEIRAMVTNAAKGAGYSWGMAQEAGNSAKQLAKYGLNCIGAFTELLETASIGGIESLKPILADNNLVASSGKICSLQLGCLISDLPEVITNVGSVEFDSVQQPIILLPFLQAMLDDQTSISVTTKDAAFFVSSMQIELVSNSTNANVETTVRLEFCENEHPTVSSTTSSNIIAINQTDWTRLERLAAKTYVPESELSRSRGAG